ncbi:MAG: IS4 family transposase [Phycisphaerae bacterium]|nr:IS4 family transposase [Phycisphaerae bacterium]
MSKNNIDTIAENSEKISGKIQKITLNSVRKVMPDSAIEQACNALSYKYRRRVITPIVTVLHMILAAIWPEESFAASWQVLWASVASRFGQEAAKSPSLGSVAKARARLPIELWKNLFEWISQRAQVLSEQFDKWRGLRVVLLDGTCVSMPDVPELFDEFGTSTGQRGKGKYPLARLVTICIANTMTVLDYMLGRYDQDENTLARPLLNNLRKGDILLADRHFAAAHYYAYYLSRGLEFLTRAHQRLKVSRIKRITSYSRNDFIGWLEINPVYRRQDPDLPTKIMVRFIQAVVRIRGKRKVVWLVSSLLDAKLYPAAEIARLYGARWRIEMLFRSVKINLSADVLRSFSPQGIHKEVASRLIAVNIVRMIMLEAAIENGVDPIRISFVCAVRIILTFAPALATEPIWKLPEIYRTMLREIASHLVPERPGRNEPRAIRRELKHYPSLRTTRAEWRKHYAA